MGKCFALSTIAGKRRTFESIISSHLEFSISYASENAAASFKRGTMAANSIYMVALNCRQRISNVCNIERMIFVGTSSSDPIYFAYTDVDSMEVYDANY